MRPSWPRRGAAADVGDASQGTLDDGSRVRGERWLMSSQPNGAVAARVAALAVVIVFLQTGVISEVPIFGVADI